LGSFFVRIENRFRDFLFANARPVFRFFSYIKHFPITVKKDYYPRLKHSFSSEIPLPSRKLMYLVGMSEDVDWFIRSGKLGADSIRTILSNNNLRIEKFGSILDFGVGCGRVMRHWRDLKGPALHGCDYNPLLIDWDQNHLSFAKFSVNPLRGRLNYSDNSFDLIYALSVFTHLSIDNQNFWIEELTRVVKPGGYLLFTTHGDWYLDQLPRENQAKYRAGEPVVFGAEQEGSNICTTFHPYSYVVQTMARHLQLVEAVPEGAWGNPKQDAYLFQKP
jgi:SAM-dependent methyltransferase